MGKHAVKILKLETKELIQMLNEALSEEWLAYYQYWIGARIMEGPMRSEVEAELLVHADEELSHAVQVVDRIITLGGTPVLNPSQWTKLSKCAYEEPNDPYVETILNQNLDGERCAIKRYDQIAEFTHGKDHTTHQMAINILNDELEHEEDIEGWLEDLNRMREDFKKLRM
ncbi:MAG TPA: ferritin-like domain-containing protein [Bacteroidales bacterium]|nr:ferritin-like domain-containing protein [Bacteroidales bacterium]